MTAVCASLKTRQSLVQASTFNSPALLTRKCAATSPFSFGTRRFRSSRGPKERTKDERGEQRFQPYGHLRPLKIFGARPKYPNPPPNEFQLKPWRPLTPDSPNTELLLFFTRNVARWAGHPRVAKRLAEFGVPKNHIKALLSLFILDVEAQRLHRVDKYGQLRYGIARFGRAQDEDLDIYYDEIYTSILYQWVASPPSGSYLTRSKIPASALQQMCALSAAASQDIGSGLRFNYTRGMRRRFIMHVGPTNSGKTYHALRALAAAPSGIYAGPLRLLAHEIWERLNFGQIVPAGVDETQIQMQDDNKTSEDTNLDIPPDSPALVRKGRTRYARPCNMTTGEEIKIVSPDAKLTSATVEMLNTNALYDVAVIDEIQMIADPERGFAWTNAVLGTNAYEIHLCGEETAVLIVKALLAGTGDSLEIRKYDRLTPLRIENKSLEGNLNNVRPGDCLVVFSRPDIFSFKKKVEALGLRAATIYGKLPPEVRSQQAEDFNDPDGPCDVLIGSDALGLGLNLKIRRMIFTKVAKNYRRTQQPLSVSMAKQIAGRAGRFGLHNKDETPEGLVTTLHEKDLHFLRKTLPIMPAPLPTARISVSADTMDAVYSQLPAGTPLRTMIDAHVYTGRVPVFMRYGHSPNRPLLCDWLENTAGGVSENRAVFGGDMVTVALLLSAPLPWRDERSINFCKALMHHYQTDLVVNLDTVSAKDGFLELLETLEQAYSHDSKDGKPKRSTMDDLSMMETFHHCLGAYVWLSYRRPTSFPDLLKVQALMPRVQRVISAMLAGSFEQNLVQEQEKMAAERLAGLRKEKVDATRLLTKQEIAGLVAKQERAPLKVTKIDYAAEKVQYDAVREVMWSEFLHDKEKEAGGRKVGGAEGQKRRAPVSSSPLSSS